MIYLINLMSSNTKNSIVYGGQLTILIHFFIIFLIFSGSDIIHPLLVVQIPADGLLDALLKLQRRLPTQLPLQLRRINRIAQIVSGTVGHIGDQIHVLSFLTPQQTIHRVDHDLDDVDILPLVETADVVCLGNLSLVENQVDGTRVILHIEPVAHVLAFAVYRKRLTMADVVNKERDQLLRELVGPVVVRTVRHDRRHAVRIVERTHEVVARRLRCRIRTVRIVFGRLKEKLFAIGKMMFARGGLGGERRLDAVGMRQFQRPIHFVS